MIAPTLVHTQLIELINYFIQELDRYDQQVFQHKNDESTWSLAQMYQHVYTASTFFIYNVNNCLHQKKGSSEGDKTAVGKQLYENNGFPEQKLKLPKAWDNGKGPEIKSQALIKQQWLDLLSQITELVEAITKDQGDYKTKHVIFGMLTAIEWYQQIEMHMRHHLRQKKELEGFVNINSTEFKYKNT